MAKGEKRVLNIIIMVMLIFVIGTAASSYYGRIDNVMKNKVQITVGDAREIAISDTECDKSEVVFTKQAREKENGIYAYEIEFNDGITRYEYEINAETGEIISSFSVIMY